MAQRNWRGQGRAVCQVPDCPKFVHGHSYCTMHEKRWLKHGDPLYVRPVPPIKHGSVTGYNSGCHCERCRAAIAAWAKDRRKINPQAGYTVPTICAKCGRKFMAQSRQKARRPQRFCSRECAGTLKGSARRMNLYRPGHLLASKSGRVQQSRLVLFEKIGYGPHLCHWCGNGLVWSPGKTRNAAKICADHLDNDTQNNRPENLVPACIHCNALRGMIRTWEMLTGRSILDLHAA